MDLELVKNVMALYGLFEDQIERWVRFDRRRGQYLNKGYFRSLRIGSK